MRFSCPFCRFTVSVEDSAKGSRTVCPGCGKNVLVPSGRFDEGCIIGDFIINSHLGRGSIGDVYKATQISLDRPVALKILTPKFMTKKGVADFLKEARAAAPLSHNNLVQSYAVGMDDGYIYMAMTYIKGETLGARLKREGRIPVDEALHIVQQVAEALYYAWSECRIIHRDVKPENIMLTENGVVKLTDLGLAMTQFEWREDMDISGSPSYMSPEQFSGAKLDTRSDIYSLGITLYQMISGRLPFEADTVTTLAHQHFETKAVPLDSVIPGVPPRVVALVRKMMAKSASDRFSDMEELLREIWTIRQRTAPNRDMVPDVHTISVKRLDYDFQNVPSRQSRDLSAASKNGQAASGILQPPGTAGDGKTASSFKVILISFLAVLAVLLLAAFGLMHLQESRWIKMIEHDLNSFESLAADPACPLDRLEQEASALQRKYEKDFQRIPCFRYAPDRIRYLLMTRRMDEAGTRSKAAGVGSGTNPR